MNETPRTDVAVIDNAKLTTDWGYGELELVQADFARTLELELNESQANVRYWKEHSNRLEKELQTYSRRYIT